jgi:hypothetical protein
MKQLILASALVAIAFASQPALSQTPKSADNAAQTQPPAPNPAEFDKQLVQMREHMQTMQAQMDKIAKTQDPQERQRLLQEHGNSMQAAMSVMHGMWGGGGAGCCNGQGMMGPGMMMGWGHMRGYYSKLTPEQLRQRQYMMDQYLPMQQMMMNHMMQHQMYMRPN